MFRLTPISTRTDTLLSYTTLFLSIELEAGGIAFRVVHPAAHIGIDRKPAVADAELVAFERSVGQVAQREIAHRRESLRTIQQMPGPRHMISPPLFLRRTALWSETPLPLSSWLVKRPPVAGP